jgi:hypothetical protein
MQSSRRVLVLEPDTDVRALLVEVLLREGLVPLEGSGPHAAKLLDAADLPCDLVIASDRPDGNMRVPVLSYPKPFHIGRLLAEIRQNLAESGGGKGASAPERWRTA